MSVGGNHLARALLRPRVCVIMLSFGFETKQTAQTPTTGNFSLLQAFGAGLAVFDGAHAKVNPKL